MFFESVSQSHLKAIDKINKNFKKYKDCRKEYFKEDKEADEGVYFAAKAATRYVNSYRGLSEQVQSLESSQNNLTSELKTFLSLGENVVSKENAVPQIQEIKQTLKDDEEIIKYIESFKNFCAEPKLYQ